ncbi:MAG: molecular chaperone DnaJ [Clostridiales bacterium]|jgi:molecular chaperone DnaJ|nr:molecular chaperone DnaJ [Clostridiales bacterium]
MAEQDYYKILGVSKSASEDEIKSAYRKLAKQYHPDLYSGKPAAEKSAAEAKFKEISRAYDCLGDSQKRAQYDQFGSEDGPLGGGAGGAGGGFWRSGGGGMGGFEDIFSNIFSSAFSGGGRRAQNNVIDGDDITVTLTLAFKEAAFGCTKEVPINRVESCSECGGTGAKSTNSVKQCPKCRGTGVMTQTLNTPFGQMATTKTCDQCGGRGKIITDPCKVCNGSGRIKKVRTLNVSVPAGIDNNQVMTYYNQGNSGFNGGRNGSVLIVINVRPHKLFVRKGSDLYIDVPITMTQAALGCKILIPTLESPVSYAISEGAQNGQQFRIKGYGIKNFKRETRGDLYVKLTVEIPKNLSSKERDMLRGLENTLGANQYPAQKEFLENIKEI